MMKKLRLVLLLVLLGAGFKAHSQCNELFFSEYIEGSSNNKALEIFNPTANSVNLANYEIQRFSNGGIIGTSLSLVGTISPKGTYVVANPSSIASILAKADTTSSVINFNGDDAVALINIATGDTADIFGEIGVDPGTAWNVGSGTSANSTLVRMPSVQMGTKDWVLGASQYLVYAQDFSDSLGTHTMNACGSSGMAVIDFDTAIDFIQESGGTYTVNFNFSSPSTTVDTVIISLSGDATLGVDYTTTLPSAGTNMVMLVTPIGSTTASFGVNVVNDLLPETNELIIMVMDTVMGGSQKGANTVFNLTILDDDAVIPYYTISQIDGIDASGVADSLGVQVRISGVVHGFNLRPNGFEFTLMDGTGGIQVFSVGSNLGYFATETDSLLITGTIRQDRGLLQIEPSNVDSISSNAMLQVADTVTQLGEATESDLITIRNVMLVDTADWAANTTPEGITVDITNGTNTYVLFVDNNTTLYTEPVPEGLFHVTGIGSQLSDSLNGNFLDGYRIVPRYKEDLEEAILIEPLVSFSSLIQSVNEGAGTVSIQITINDPDSVNAMTVDLGLSSTSTATNGSDFIFPSMDTTLIFPANSSATQTLTFSIIDDQLIEGNEQLVLVLRNPSSNVTVVIDTLIVTIVDNDSATALVSWNFDDSDSIADGGIAVNTSRIMRREPTYAGTFTFSAGATGSSFSSNGWDGGTGTKYYIFEMSTAGYGSLSLSSKHRSSNTGPADFKAQYRNGANGTWTDIPNAIVEPENNFNFELVNVAIPAAANNQSSLFIRYVMTTDSSVSGGTVSSGGTSRLDDVMVSGSLVTKLKTDVTSLDLSVYPNPSNGIFNLQMTNSVKGNVTLTVSDITGRVISSQNLPSSAVNNGQVNLSNNPAGIYLLQVITEQGTTVKRLIVR